jgi:hypothetical protein
MVEQLMTQEVVDEELHGVGGRDKRRESGYLVSITPAHPPTAHRRRAAGHSLAHKPSHIPPACLQQRRTLAQLPSRDNSVFSLCTRDRPGLSKWFYDTSTDVATGAVRCDFFVGGAFGILIASYG